MFWWEPSASGGITAARAVPAGGQEVCSDGLAKAASSDVAPAEVPVALLRVLLPGIGDPTVEPQAAASNNRRQQPTSANMERE